MTRDYGLEAQMVRDFGSSKGLEQPAMFGGLCFMLNGHMLGAARRGQAMFRVGATSEDQALALSGTGPMIHGGRRKRGFVVLTGSSLSDHELRLQLAGMARSYVETLPPKDH